MRKVFLMASLLAALCALPTHASELSRADSAAVRKVLATYVSEWLAGNPAGVMRQLSSDSVMVPGDRPAIVGSAAIQGYWWPKDAPPFKLDRYTTTVDQVTGSADVATVRGTQEIEWTSGGARWKTHGNYVTVLRRTNAGWRIVMQIAANAPNEKVAS